MAVETFPFITLTIHVHDMPDLEHFVSLDQVVLYLAKHGQINIRDLALKHEAWERDKRRFYRRPHDEVDGPPGLDEVHDVLWNICDSVERRYGLEAGSILGQIPDWAEPNLDRKVQLVTELDPEQAHGAKFPVVLFHFSNTESDLYLHLGPEATKGPRTFSVSRFPMRSM